MAVAKKVLVMFFLYLHLASGDSCKKESDDGLSFEEYLVKFQIAVPTEELRVKYREQFYETKSEIEKFNSQSGHTYKQAINAFAHLRYDEVVQDSFGLSLLFYSNPRKHIRDRTLAKPACTVAPIDWRKKGAVTPVKKQGMCGVCYIFSAVAAIESLVYIKTNKSVVLSEQFVMDCMNNYWKINNDACNGGQPDYVFNFAIAKKGLPLSSEYPYFGIDRRVCKPRTLVEESAIKSFKTLMIANEDALVCHLMNSPVSVAVAVNSSFLRYSSGIYNDEASCRPNAMLNHALLLVGYDRDPTSGLEYFILKNSWGASFGEKGYIRMQKGVKLCGITSLVQQPSFEPVSYLFA